MEVTPCDTLQEDDLHTVHRWLTSSYWAEGRSLETQRAACAGSLNFLVRVDGVLVGFARVVTDRATFAWVCDVVVDEPHQGQGVGKALMQAVMDHPDMQGLRRIVLATRDAHGLYARYGFKPLPFPERWMMLRDPAP